MKRGIAAAVAAMMLASCATTGGKAVDQDAIASLKPGVTTIAEVESAYGKPFNETKEPDGTDQLQYVSNVREVDNTQPMVGSNIPQRVSKTESAMLVFDQSGHFVRAWTKDGQKTTENPVGNLGNGQPSDFSRGSLYGGAPGNGYH
jgi:outer membrane protein assembly factor BamE (lipoprotein component of BamABCDE complex)